MNDWKHNGERWWRDERPILKRARQWLVWFGGWEKANGAGWSFRRGGPTPISLLGHRFTLHRWGWALRTRTGHWVRTPDALYLSIDGTPRGAVRYLVGTPEGVQG